MTNRDRLIASLKRRRRVVEEATRAMIADLERSHHNIDVVRLNTVREQFLKMVDAFIENTADPNSKYVAFPTDLDNSATKS